MKRRNIRPLAIWLIWLGLMGAWLWNQHSAEKTLRMIGDGAQVSGFAGTDWVRWENADNAIVAAEVHPLRRYKPFPEKIIQQGDRLRKINYEEVLSAEAAERLMAASPQGKTFIFQITPENAPTDATFETRRVQSGFVLPYMAHRHGNWWRIQAWLAGLLLVVALMVALILFPIIKTQWLRYLPLLLVVGCSLLLATWQSVHALYLVLESDLIWPGFARIGLVFITVLLPVYGLVFLVSKKSLNIWQHLTMAASLIPVILWTATWWKEPVSNEHMFWLMETSIGSFLIFLAGGTALELLDGQNWKSLVVWLKLGVVGIASLLFVMLWSKSAEALEINIFALHLLLYFPLLDAAQNELRFGKVSLVVTRALQGVAFLAFSILGYFLITSLFTAILPDSPYRTILEVVVLLLALLAGRWVYRANERRLSAYFTTTQQNKLDSFREFLASIPRYTSADTLREDVLQQANDYFGAEARWWEGGEGDEGEEAWQQQLKDDLIAARTFWAISPELGGLRPDGALREKLEAWPYVLALPLAAEDEDADMLLLSRKRRGVYNLADLDLLFQLARQTHLTLNMLALLDRERELMRSNYEANLTVLRAQINPHFLFNTLNTISALVHDAPDLAEEAVEHLAFIFRYTLDHSGDRFVQLKKELSLVSTYLEIEKIRFGERILVSIDADSDANDTMIPGLVIQTLIENCIKHGIGKIIGKGIVSIDVYIEDEMTIIEVYDNGPGIDFDRINKGTGLNNVITRLSHIYQNKDSLRFENTGDGTRAILRIPKRPPQATLQSIPPNDFTS